MESILTFEQRYDAIVDQIEKRRKKWTLASTSFDDIKQVILSRVYLKYHTYDHKRPEGFSHWLSAVISSVIKNALRDLHYIHSRPCIQGRGGCVFNTGNGTCSKNSSGIQCSQCLAYKLWEAKKKAHNAIKQTLPLENHLREVEMRPTDSVDIEAAKLVIDREIKEKLNLHEWRMYKMLYIQNKDEREVGRLMKYKATKKDSTSKKMYPGYLTILKFKKKVVMLSREIIEDQNLA